MSWVSTPGYYGNFIITRDSMSFSPVALAFLIGRFYLKFKMASPTSLFEPRGRQKEKKGEHVFSFNVSNSENSDTTLAFISFVVT